MPKETIHHSQPDGNGGYLDGGPQVTVSWHRDLPIVQIGCHTHEPDSGQFMDLDRAEINRLIRVLRRARDMSFGRDE